MINYEKVVFLKMAGSKTKKTPEEIKRIILDKLKDGPKTVTEISEQVNSNWITIEEYLKKLKEDGLVIEIISSPKMKIYRRVDDLAFYGLPFSKNIRDDSFALLCKIAKMWREENDGKAPSRTILQKVAVRLIDESNGEIKIPVLKFHYGQTLALRYDEQFENECKKFDLSSSQKSNLLTLIKEYKNLFSNEARLYQYEKEEMKFYKIKEELLEAFSGKEDREEIIKKILELSVYYPSELEETYKIFDKFEYCSINILNIRDSDLRREYIQRLKEIFSLIWDSITTSYFFYESECYIEDSKKDLFNYIKLNTMNVKISNVVPSIEDLKSEIDSIPEEKIDMEMSEKSEELLGMLLNGLE